jgi:hypothetical protein
MDTRLGREDIKQDFRTTLITLSNGVGYRWTLAEPDNSIRNIAS